eukprot:jgi/Botrbrau1/22136/Bobra.0206s0060.1
MWWAARRPRSSRHGRAWLSVETSVRLEDCALRYEHPPGSPGDEEGRAGEPPVVAVVLVGSAHWASESDKLAQELEVQTISVFGGKAAARGAEWDTGTARDIPSCHLLEEGFTCIAQEGRLCVTLRQPEEAFGGPVEIEVRNERLQSALNPSSASLGNKLAAPAGRDTLRDGPFWQDQPSGPQAVPNRGTLPSYRTPPSPRRTASAVNAAAQAHVLDGYQALFPPPYREDYESTLDVFPEDDPAMVDGPCGAPLQIQKPHLAERLTDAGFQRTSLRMMGRGRREGGTT